MKKIIISLLLIGIFAFSGSFTYAKTIELNTVEYIKTINTNISRLNAELENKEKVTIGTIFLNGIEEGYIKPSINNDVKLKSSIVELIDNIENIKTSNNNLQIKHGKLVIELKELTTLLNNTIECKTKILDSNSMILIKCKNLLFEDDKKINIVNKKIDSINTLYKEINNFGVNANKNII